MPNWCSTSYVIEGAHETLKKINDAILHHDVQEGSSDNWEGNILKALGITWKDKTPDGGGDYIRGFIDEDPSLGEDTLEFYAEEAWGVTDFGKLLEEHFKDIKVYFKGEEPMMDVFITNDEGGRYFPERYYLDVCINGSDWSDYFEEEKGVWDKLSELSDGKIKNKEDVDKFEEDSERDDDDFISLHEFQIRHY